MRISYRPNILATCALAPLREIMHAKPPRRSSLVR